ncbi:PAS domain S-box protein [Halobacteria archaeon AArc-curdl1]|uniref:PAS domain S-box protein n=1 Tax=Natronosalvus hydrolyticus TaxID=2979988 RepID=A0AAP2ZAY6_9EURY|nr:PAS domain S-box protein [Halobacteria archaeon AArc-curdl1]
MHRTTDHDSSTVLLTGRADWVHSVGERLEEAFEVVGPVTSVADVELEAIDCVLTDDCKEAQLTDAPVVVGPSADTVNSSESTSTVGEEGLSPSTNGGSTSGEPREASSTHLEAALEAGAADVVQQATLEQTQLLVHRLESVIDQARSGRELEARESWYQTLIENSPALFFVLDTDRRHTFTGPSVKHVAGYDPESLLGEQIDDCIHEADRETFRETFETVLEGEVDTSESCEYRFKHGDGSWRVHEAIVTNQLAHPAVDGVVVSVRDITAYRHVERELTKSFERVTDAFISLDSTGRFTYLNKRAELFFQTPREELLGRSIFKSIPGLDDSAFTEAALTSYETQEQQTVEQYYEPFDRWVEARIFPSESGLSIYFSDVTDRVEREQALVERSERLQVIVENAPVVLFSLDENGVFTLSEGSALERIGLEPGEVVGESATAVFADHPEIVEDIETALDGHEVHVFREVGGRVFETWYRPVVTGSTLDRVIGIGIDVTEREQYEETLNTLYEATEHLLTVESKAAACEYVTDVAADVLDLSNVVVYQYDERENELAPAAYTTGLLTQFGTPPRFAPGEGTTWDVFLDGETVVRTDDPALERLYDDATVRSGLWIPLGEHGVLVAHSSESDSFDENTVELAKAFGATAETALDRIGRTQRLHEREQELKRQNEHLERLNDASQLREDIESLLLRANSRAEIEEGVCDRLLEIDGCAYAWIGEPDPGGNEVISRHAAGVGRDYLEQVTVTALDDEAAEPAGRAVRSRTPISVPAVAEDLRQGAWRSAALSRDFQSVHAVPIVYDDFLYGVVTLYSTERNGFDEPTRTTLAELGETIAYAIDSVQRKQALLGEGITEIELETAPDPTLMAVAELAGAPLEIDGIIPQEDGSTTVFATVSASLTGDTLADSDATGTIISRDSSQTVVQLAISGPFLTPVIQTYGGTLRSCTVDPESGTRATLEVPKSVDVREVLTDLNRRGLATTLLARRESPDDHNGHERPMYDTNRASALEELTDRQREVVQTAYHGGYFEWPRVTTGEEVATSLGISAPAFHNHVRTAERKVFRKLFDREH